MKNTKLTKQQIQAMSLPEKAMAFFAAHPSNTQGNTRYPNNGPSYIAQSKFWNNWQQALTEWTDSLPLN